MTVQPHKGTFLIGVAGGTASGKTTLCRDIIKKLNLTSVLILTMDHFYKPLSKQQHENSHDYNFDHPNAFDWDLYVDVLRTLKRGETALIPEWDYTTHSRKQTFETLDGADIDVIVCEGILTLYDTRVRSMLDLKLFVQADADLRLMRRIRRDTKERGRSLVSVLAQYEKTVKPSHDLYCDPSMKYSDIVINGVIRNDAAVDVLCRVIMSRLGSSVSSKL